MQKDYFEINVSFTPFDPELTTGIFQMLNVEGILQEDNYLVAYFKEFDSSCEKILIDFFTSMKKELLIENFSFQSHKLTNKNWNEEWEKSIEPIKVSDKFVIKPSFKPYTKNSFETVLTIDPKMSFGTGYHQTTRIMIKLIEKLISKDSVVLDIGTGTGILGIVAAKSGAKKVITLDNDDVCEENATENINQNDVSEIVSFFVGEINDVADDNFDLILANINRNILLDICEPIKQRIKKNGLIILSGLLNEDKTIISESYCETGLELIDTLSEDEWMGLVFRN